MGKTPKRADPPAPGGDERNSCVRGSSLQERQRESDNSNRHKLSNIQKKVYSSSKKRLNKGKTRNFAKCSSPSNTGREQVQNTEDLSAVQSTMRPESEEPEVKLDTTDSKGTCQDDTDNKVAESVSKDSNTNYAKEESNEVIDSETKAMKIPEENVSAEECSKSQEKTTENEKENIKENGKQVEEHEQEPEEIQLTLRVEESSMQSQEAVCEYNENDRNETKNINDTKETNEITNEIKITQTEPQSDTESCSVDLVESTTSDLSEMTSQSQQQDVQKENGKRESSVTYDVSGISYDSSIALKDVKIHLNDCLKDSKRSSVSKDNDTTIDSPWRDMSFGKTLRNISGRYPIKRLQHDRSSELFNRFHSKSALSLSLPSEATTNAKILRYTTGLSESFSTNGSSTERKRKLESTDWNTAKKRKTDNESSLLNASMGLLRGLRKPIQVSTSNVTYEIHSDKTNISNLSDDNDKFSSTHTEGIKKWCVIM